MDRIINKKSYWGNHTFVASAYKSTVFKATDINQDAIRIDIYRNVPLKYETSVVILSKEDLIEKSKGFDLNSYTGNLEYNVEEFLNSFKYML